MSQARADRIDRLLKLEAVRRQAILEIPRDGSLDTVAELLASIVVDLLELRLAARAKVAAAGCEIS